MAQSGWFPAPTWQLATSYNYSTRDSGPSGHQAWMWYTNKTPIHIRWNFKERLEGSSVAQVLSTCLAWTEAWVQFPALKDNIGEWFDYSALYHFLKREKYTANQAQATDNKSTNYTHSRVLAGMWCKILKGPLDVLVRSQLSSKCRRLLTAEPQNAVVGRQHPTVKKHHILIIMVSKDVIEGNVLGYHWVLNNKADILWTVSTHIVPKWKQSLFIVICSYCWLRKLRLEKVPQIHEICGKHQLLSFGN